MRRRLYKLKRSTIPSLTSGTDGQLTRLDDLGGHLSQYLLVLAVISRKVC
jgi:hypothetical protein